MDKRIEGISQAVNKTEMDILSGELSDDISNSYSNQELETYMAACRDLLAARPTEIEFGEDVSVSEIDVLSGLQRTLEFDHSISEFEKSFGSSTGLLAARQAERKLDEEFKTYIKAYRDMLVARRTENKLAEDGSKSKLDTLSTELDETSEADSKQEFETYIGEYRDVLVARRTENKLAEDGCKPKLYTLSTELDETSDADSKQEFETYIGDYRDLLAARPSEKKCTEDSIKSELDILSAEFSETSDSSQEYKALVDAYKKALTARQSEKCTEDFSQPEMNISPVDSVETLDADSSKEYEKYISVYKDWLLSAITEDDNSSGEFSKMDGLKKENIRLLKYTGALKRSISKRKEDIRRVKEEARTMQKLDNYLINAKESELEEVIERLDSMMSQKK